MNSLWCGIEFRLVARLQPLSGTESQKQSHTGDDDGGILHSELPGEDELSVKPLGVGALGGGQRAHRTTATAVERRFFRQRE